MNLTINNPITSFKIIKDTLNSDGVRTIQVNPDLPDCCSQIDLLLYDNTVLDVVFTDTMCKGSSKAIGALCRGMHVDMVIMRLSGITCESCENRKTSCSDQIAQALISTKRRLPNVE